MLYSNFYRAVWYIPQSERESVKPSSFLLQSPSYKLYTQIGNNLILDGIIPESTDELVLKACLKDTLNVEGLVEYSQLPLDVQKELFDKILELFYPNSIFIGNLEFSLDAILDDRFSNDTWNCTTCQAKGLDKQRNCPMRDAEEYHEEAYSITVGDVPYTICPMPRKDQELIALAFEAYKILDSGFLVEEGAYGDQPLLFCLLAQKVKDKIKSYEQKAMNDTKAKSKG